jgi:SAM-dependent methyltransferase
MRIMSIYQDGTYLAQHPTWDEEDSEWKAGQLLNILERNRIEFSSFVDIGCGAGRVIHELSRRYPSAIFHGYDVSPHAIELARRYETSNVRFFNRDVFEDRAITDRDKDDRSAPRCESLQESARYDVAAAIDVFEHVEDYLGFLRKLRGICRWCLFHIPLDISVQAILRDLPMNNRRTAGHLHYFMKETALATLEHAGYEVLDYCYTPGGLALARSLRAKLAAIPRMVLFKIHPDWCVKILGGYTLLVLARGRLPEAK